MRRAGAPPTSARTSLSALPGGARPFAEVVVNNTRGARLDSFVARSVTYSASSCHGSPRPSSVVLRLDNNTTEEPPPFLAAHSDHPPAGTRPTQLRFSVR